MQKYAIATGKSYKYESLLHKTKLVHNFHITGSKHTGF